MTIEDRDESGSGPPAHVREARASDLPAVARLAGSLVRMHHELDPRRFMLGDRVEEGYAWWLGKEIERDGALVLVAERPREGGAARADLAIVGYAYATIDGRDWNRLLDAHGELHDVLVDPSERGGGVGRSLVEAVVAAMQARGVPRLVLSTAFANGRAREFFAGLGFRPTMIEMTRDLS